MDLFHMRRYVEESEEKEDIPPNQIVQSLNSRVKNKKRKSGDEDSNGSPPKKPNEDEQKKETGRKATKKRNKKKKAKKLDSDTGFTVLGEKCNKNKSTVRRVLPHWLSNPNVVSVDYTEDQLPVDEFEGLDSELIAKLKEKGVTQLFPVQRQVIPRLLKYPLASFFRPSDICVSAPTGSGKTLAFALPIIQSIKCRVVPRVRALVILPVQDLAKQIFKVFLTYCLETGLKVKLLSVNKAFAQEQSELVKKSQSSGKIYHSLADIIITTPGRLVDHIQRTEGFSLEHLRYIIIDEADRVMEDLQNDWLTHVESAVYVGGRNRPGPKNVLNTNKRELPLQKLLFSATLSQNPEQLEELNLYEPKLFTSIVKPKDILGNQAEEGRENADLEFIGQYTTPAELTENIVVCNDPLKKPLILHHLLETMGKTKVLIFTNSIEHTHFLAVLLQEYGIVAGELSSKAKDKRARVLNKFSSGSLDVLVCSDALARGIDIGTTDLVISYDCPQYVKTYIHRVGRTARAGQKGTAVTILQGKKEEKQLKAMMKEAGKTMGEAIDIDEDELDDSSYQEAKVKAAKVIRNEKLAVHDKKKQARGGAKKNKPRYKILSFKR